MGDILESLLWGAYTGVSAGKAGTAAKLPDIQLHEGGAHLPVCSLLSYKRDNTVAIPVLIVLPTGPYGKGDTNCRDEVDPDWLASFLWV